MINRYVEVTDEYIKQLEHEIDNLKAINGSIHLMMGNCNTTLTAQQILDLNIYTFDLIDYDHDKFLEFYKLGDSNEI